VAAFSVALQAAIKASFASATPAVAERALIHNVKATKIRDTMGCPNHPSEMRSHTVRYGVPWKVENRAIDVDGGGICSDEKNRRWTIYQVGLTFLQSYNKPLGAWKIPVAV
jgi:hypothetical protein